METSPYMSFRSSANLVVLENGVVRSFPLELKNVWLLGRISPDSNPDIVLESKIVSRKHGRFQNIDGEWYFIDTECANGTYYNGKKITINQEKGESDAVKLKNGDILRVDSASLDEPEERGVFMMFSTVGIGNQWKTITLKKKETYFGRDEKCDVVIPAPYISGRHMVITRKNNNYYIMDCDSKAGTWINNNKVHGEILLIEKDMIAVCDCTMLYTGNKIIYNVPTKAGRNNIVPPIREELQDTISQQPNVQINEDINNSEQINNEPEHIEKGPIILRANIKTRKVPSNEGHGLKELIRDVKVEVEEGSLVALLGGAGAGKSTVMNCMNGMDTAGMEGEVEFNGVNLVKYFERMKYMIGSVPQSEVFHEGLTVEKELKDAARIRLPGDTKDKEIKARVDYTLKQLGIENIRKNLISKCSGGERRRVNIGIELVADRKLLCLDEPDAGLDPGNKRKLFETLRNLAHDEGKSILTIIHDVSDISLFDKVIIMNKVDNVGRLAFVGTPDEARKYFGVEMKDVYQVMAKNPEKYIWEK